MKTIHPVSHSSRRNFLKKSLVGSAIAITAASISPITSSNPAPDNTKVVLTDTTSWPQHFNVSLRQISHFSDMTSTSIEVGERKELVLPNGLIYSIRLEYGPIDKAIQSNCPIYKLSLYQGESEIPLSYMYTSANNTSTFQWLDVQLFLGENASSQQST